MSVLSIIIPVLDEAETIAAALFELRELRTRGVEVIVVDGGSTDETLELARPLADQVISAPRGRGAQMNAGAEIAQGHILLFLHADTRLPPDADTQVMYGRDRDTALWGRFDVTIVGQHPLLPIVARFMNWRSRLSHIATGDQAMFVQREAFRHVGGFADIPLMEDIEISDRLNELGPPLCLTAKVRTSGRRWEKHGLFKTVWTMWRLRYAYFRGADPVDLARDYGYLPRLAEPTFVDKLMDRGSKTPERPD